MENFFINRPIVVTVCIILCSIGCKAQNEKLHSLEEAGDEVGPLSYDKKDTLNKPIYQPSMTSSGRYR